MIAPPLLFVPSTFLTIIGLSNFCSLNPCLAAILLSMNIPMAPLSKSAFTVTPSCVFNFSTPTFNHTSLSILKVLLTSLQLFPSFAALSSSSDHALLCYAFASLGCTVFLAHPHHFISSNFLLRSLLVLYYLLYDTPDVTNFIWPYLHQFFIDSHSLNGYRKPLKRPFDRY